MSAIYLRHDVHGTKVAISEPEAVADQKNGWRRFAVADVQATPVQVEVPVRNALLNFTPKTLNDLDDNELREMYQQKTGNKAHHRLGRQAMIGKIASYGEFSERAN